jgi:hypothetical protein
MDTNIDRYKYRFKTDMTSLASCGSSFFTVYRGDVTVGIVVDKEGRISQPLAST